jgi:hypothetical protein
MGRFMILLEQPNGEWWVVDAKDQRRREWDANTVSIEALMPDDTMFMTDPSVCCLPPRAFMFKGRVTSFQVHTHGGAAEALRGIATTLGCGIWPEGEA